MLQIVKEATPDIVTALTRLLRQLSPDTELTEVGLTEALKNENYVLFIVRKNDGGIVGTIALVSYQLPATKKAWIEDFVVDFDCRGRGYGRLLIDAALAEAAKRRIAKVDLTSGHHRLAAHKLYIKAGFDQRETYVFRKRI